jgi:hypothetical protein
VIHVVAFVIQSLLWLLVFQFYCISYCHRCTCLLSELNQWFCWDIACLAMILSSFSLTRVFCVFSCCIECNLLLETISPIFKLFSCLEKAHQESFVWIYNDTSYSNCS